MCRRPGNFTQLHCGGDPPLPKPWPLHQQQAPSIISSHCTNCASSPTFPSLLAPQDPKPVTSHPPPHEPPLPPPPPHVSHPGPQPASALLMRSPREISASMRPEEKAVLTQLLQRHGEGQLRAWLSGLTSGHTDNLPPELLRCVVHGVGRFMCT